MFALFTATQRPRLIGVIMNAPSIHDAIDKTGLHMTNMSATDATLTNDRHTFILTLTGEIKSPADCARLCE